MSDTANTNQNPTEGGLLKWRKRALVIWALVGVCVLFYVFGFVLDILSVPVSIIIWCLVFVFCLNPIVDKLEKHGVGRTLGTLVAYLALILILIVMGWIMFAPSIGASSQFAALAASLPGYAQSVMDGAYALSQQYADFLKDETVRSWIQQVSDSLSGFLGNFANVAGASIMGFGSFVANTAMIIGFALVISFWILMELPQINQEMHRLVKPERRDDLDLFAGTMVSVIGGYLKATLLQCLIIGLGCGIGYTILGLPSPAALGIITGILNIIPVVGPWLGGIVAAAVGITVSPITAVIAIAIAVVIQQIVYTFVSPMLMSDSVDIHPVLVIFGLTCGSAIGGAMAGLAGSILGMLASIPMIAAAKALFVYYYELRTGRRIVSPDGVFFKGAVSEDSEEFNPTMDASAPMPQQVFTLPNINQLPPLQQTKEQKEAARQRVERRMKRLARLRGDKDDK